MLDKVIHKHIDSMDILEQGLSEDIDKLIASIDISTLIDNVDTSIEEIVVAIESLIQDKYAHVAIDNGILFAREVESLKRDIKVQDSNDGTLNEDQFDDKSGDSRRD